MRKIRDGRFNVISQWNYGKICEMVGGGEATIAHGDRSICGSPFPYKLATGPMREVAGARTTPASSRI